LNQWKIPFIITAYQIGAQSGNLQILLFCHSGLDPESRAFLMSRVSGCRIKSGMTDRNQELFWITVLSTARESL